MNGIRLGPRPENLMGTESSEKDPFQKASGYPYGMYIKITNTVYDF
jgi:hypothetical protein